MIYSKANEGGQLPIRKLQLEHYKQGNQEGICWSSISLQQVADSTGQHLHAKHKRLYWKVACGSMRARIVSVITYIMYIASILTCQMYYYFLLIKLVSKLKLLCNFAWYKHYNYQISETFDHYVYRTNWFHLLIVYFLVIIVLWPCSNCFVLTSFSNNKHKM